MRDTWGLYAGLFAAAGLAGNAGLMMWAGFLPSPGGRWFAPVSGCLVLLSIQIMSLMVVVEAYDERRARTEATLGGGQG